VLCVQDDISLENDKELMWKIACFLAEYINAKWTVVKERHQ